MAEITDFLSAVGSHWVALMSGIVSALIALWIKAKHKPDIGERSFWGIALLCLCIAFFLAWRDEHRKLEKTTEALESANAKFADLTKPKFEFYLHQAIYNYQAKQKATAFLIDAMIVNKGADSAVVGWFAHYKSSTLSTDVPFARPDKEPVIFGAQGQSLAVAYYGSQSLQGKTTNPIARGGMRTGRILLSIPGDRVKELRQGDALITIMIRDYLSQSYIAKFRSGGSTGMLEFFPDETPAKNKDRVLNK